MQDYDNNKNSNIRRMPAGERQPRPNRPPRPDGAPRSGQARPSGQSRPAGQMRPDGTGRTNGQSRPVSPARRQSVDGMPRPSGAPRQGGQVRPSGQSRPTGQMRPDGTMRSNGQSRPTGQPRRQGTEGPQRSARPQRSNTRPDAAARRQNPQAKGKPRKNPKNLTPQQAAKKKRKKIVMFVAEIFLLLILLGALWAVNKANKIQYVDIKREDVFINDTVINEIDQGTSNMKGYRNIALFGVDSRDQELDKNTRTDVIMIASINQDTKKVKLVSVYRDTWLNMTNDKYSKANAAYAKGGSKQAIGMLNMNLDLDITDFVTVGFNAVIKTVDAVGGVEINVTEEEIPYLNSYQISMAGKPTGDLNAAGEPNYTATPGVDYTPVTKSGLQTLNGLQATAYCRIRYVGGDGARTERQRTVLTLMAKKAMTLKPDRLDKIATAVCSEIKTSLDMSEILSLLADIASYEIGETSGFPFSDHVKMNGHVGNASVVVPIDLKENVILLHEFLFEDQEYTPSPTVEKCSQRIASDTGISYNGE